MMYRLNLAALPVSKIFVALVCLSNVLFSTSLIQADQAQYLYDDQGRLTSVSDSTGTTAVYNYDAVGNLFSIDRLTPPGSGIGIYLVNPGTGPTTDSVGYKAMDLILSRRTMS